MYGFCENSYESWKDEGKCRRFNRIWVVKSFPLFFVHIKLLCVLNIYFGIRWMWMNVCFMLYGMNKQQEKSYWIHPVYCTHWESAIKFYKAYCIHVKTMHLCIYKKTRTRKEMWIWRRARIGLYWNGFFDDRIAFVSLTFLFGFCVFFLSFYTILCFCNKHTQKYIWYWITSW